MSSSAEVLNNEIVVNTDTCIWEKILQNLHNDYGRITFENWFTHLKLKSMDSNVLTIAVPSKFIREWVITNYFFKIKEYVEVYAPNIKKIDFKVIVPKVIERSGSNSCSNENNYVMLSSPLDERFVFKNFVCNSSNLIAYSACHSLATGDSHVNNPITNLLYIHSNVGMGKTHLLQSIANYIKNNFSEKKVAYLSSEKFMYQYMVAVRDNALIAFKESLRSLDILLIDDLQFICSKNSTFKEFSNTLDALIEGGKKVVIACDKAPYALDIENRIKSRLIGGLIVDIKQSNFDLRLDILKDKSSQLSLNISTEVLEFIAYNVTSSIRELEASLHKVVTHCSLSKIDITVESAQTILNDYIKFFNLEVTLEEIIEKVSQFYNISKSDVLSGNRSPRFSKSRQIISLLAKNLTTLSLQEIGAKLGNRDHTTVIYSLRSIEKKMCKNPAILNELSSIKEMLSL